MHPLGGVERGKVGVHVPGDEGHGPEVVIVVLGLGVNEYRPVSPRVLLQFVKDVGMVDVHIVHGAREGRDV